MHGSDVQLRPPRGRGGPAEGGRLEYGLIGLLVLILDVIAIVSILGGSKPLAWKLVWILIVLFLPLIGMILYFVIGKQT